MAKMLPEQIMLRWANHHIRQYLNDNPDQTGVPKDFKISNLDADLADGKAYSIILHQVAPFDTPCDLSALKMNPERAAQKVIDDAKRIGVDKFEVQPSDITEGRPRMNLAFLAAIINSHPALEPVQVTTRRHCHCHRHRHRHRQDDDRAAPALAHGFRRLAPRTNATIAHEALREPLGKAPG